MSSRANAGRLLAVGLVVLGGASLAACTRAATPTTTSEPTTATTATTTMATTTTATAVTGTTATSTSLATTTTASTTPTTVAPSCSVPSVLAKWPIAQVAAQLVVVPVDEGDPGAIGAAVRFGVGGVILFGNDATASLKSQLATLRAETLDNRGLLVMADEEGGGIQRLQSIVPSMPWPRQMAETMSTKQVWDLTHRVGADMSQYGVNMDLAPVLDVDGRDVYPGESDPDGYRSFGGNTSVVSNYGVAYLAGLLRGGVIPVVKHFPGLGGASGNTDYGPAHTLPWKTLQKVAIPPFKAAISFGVPAVMTSNASVPGITSLPASISYAVTTRILRKQLGFKGLVITDSLSAGALSGIGYSVDQASVAAIEAGADMVLFGLLATPGNDVGQAQSVRNALVAAVRAGHLARTQLDAAAALVLAAKHVDVCPS